MHSFDGSLSLANTTTQISHNPYGEPEEIDTDDSGFGLRVHRALGDPPTLLWIVRRELIVKRLLLLIFGPLTLWTAVVADAVSPYFDERRRAGHDRIMLSFVTEE